MGRGGNRRFRPDGTPIDSDGRPSRGGQRRNTTEGRSSEGEARSGRSGPRPNRSDDRFAEGDRRRGPGNARGFRNEGDQPQGERRGAPRGRGPQHDGDQTRGPRPARQRSTGVQIKGDLLYGRNAVRESLRAGKRQHSRLFIAEGVREDDRISETIELARQQEVLLDRVPRMLLDDLTKGGNHQGVALESGEYQYVDLEDVIEAEGTILVMDHLNDPQNFGTLMRAADASGIAGIVIPQDRSVSVTPAVVNSSAGAVEHLRVAMTPNLARALDKIEESGRWIVGLDEDESDNNIFTTEIPTPVGLVLGAEGSGLTPIVRKRCQVIVSLPMRGSVDSLNAATAGSIVLYDLLRREMTQG